MWLRGTGSCLFRLLLFTFHVARISSAEHRAWREFPSSSVRRALPRTASTTRQSAVMDPVIKWSRQQFSPHREESLEKSRMVDFHSGLWRLLGQISMNDFSQESSGLSKKFYDYYKGTYKNSHGSDFPDNIPKQKHSAQMINNEPSLRSDQLFDRIHNSELGNMKLKDLPPEILKALEDFGHVLEPQEKGTIVQIKTGSHSHQTRPENNNQEDIPPSGSIKPNTVDEYYSPDDTIFNVGTSGSVNIYVPKPSQDLPPQVPLRVASEDPMMGELHLVSSSKLPFKLSSENEIKLADGANSVLEISSESHPTKYFLSASYVDPLSPSGQVKPLPMDKLFNSQLFSEDPFKSLENEYSTPQIKDYTQEKYSSQPLLSESPTSTVMNTVNKLDELFQTQNVFQFPDDSMNNDENVSSDSSGTTVSESDFFSQLQSKLAALATHVDDLTLLNHTKENIKNTEPVVVQVSATSPVRQAHVPNSSPEAFVPIPEHVSEMVKNISDIIGTNPSEDAMNAMINHFSKVFKHAETILSATFTEMPEQEYQTEPPVKLETTRVPPLSILDSPQHVIIVYRPVLFVSHSNNSDWSKVVGEGYKPTVLDEHGETSEALTKEVLNTLGPDLLDSLKEHFAKHLGSELPTSGTRKFPDSLSDRMEERKETFHFRGGYIVIDGQDNQTTSVEGDSNEVSVHEDPQKKPLSVDLIVPQNTFRLQTESQNIPSPVDKISHQYRNSAPSNTDSFSKIVKSHEQNSKPAEYVHNIIVNRNSEAQNKSKLRPILQSLQQLKEINPALGLRSNPLEENNEKKYVVRRIVKRRRKKPTKHRSKPLSRKPAQPQLSSNDRKSTEEAQQQQVKRESSWRSLTQMSKESELRLPLTHVERGRKNDEPPLIILEKPITDLPVDRLADLVMKLYTSGARGP